MNWIPLFFKQKNPHESPADAPDAQTQMHLQLIPHPLISIYLFHFLQLISAAYTELTSLERPGAQVPTPNETLG